MNGQGWPLFGRIRSVGGQMMGGEQTSRKARCLEDLRRRILTQDLEPGAYLDETQLAERYEISRPPLREILNQLAGEEYVVLHNAACTQVAPMTH